MARIRSIKPEFWTHEKPTSVSRDARLLFIGIWNFADDLGRAHDSSRELKLRILPGDDDITSADVERWLVELQGARLIQRYEANGKRYLQVLGWEHQKIQHPSDSKIPNPPEPSQSLTSPHESSLLIGREGKGREIKEPNGSSGVAPSARQPAHHLPPDWKPDTAQREYAAKLGLQPADIDREATKFVGYFVDGKGAEKRRNDRGWRQAWQNWIGTAVKNLPPAARGAQLQTTPGSPEWYRQHPEAAKSW